MAISKTKKTKKTSIAAWKRAAKRTVTASKNKPKPRKTTAAKKGKALTKAAYGRAARRSVTPSGKGPRKQSAKPKKGTAFSKVAKRTIGSRTV
ncbi:MAG: hypothetical protein ACE5RL_05020 [Nitrosarchaeum sp.]